MKQITWINLVWFWELEDEYISINPEMEGVLEDTLIQDYRPNKLPYPTLNMSKWNEDFETTNTIDKTNYLRFSMLNFIDFIKNKHPLLKELIEYSQKNYPFIYCDYDEYKTDLMCCIYHIYFPPHIVGIYEPTKPEKDSKYKDTVCLGEHFGTFNFF